MIKCFGEIESLGVCSHGNSIREDSNEGWVAGSVSMYESKIVALWVGAAPVPDF